MKSLVFVFVIAVSTNAFAGEFFAGFRSCIDRVEIPEIELVFSEKSHAGFQHSLVVRASGVARIIKRNIFNVAQEGRFSTEPEVFETEEPLYFQPFAFGEWGSTNIPNSVGGTLANYVVLETIIRDGLVEVLPVTLLSPRDRAEAIAEHLEEGGETIIVGSVEGQRILFNENAMVGLYSYGYLEESAVGALFGNYVYQGYGARYQVSIDAIPEEAEFFSNDCE